MYFFFTGRRAYKFLAGREGGGGLQVGAYKLDFKVYMSPDRRTIVRIHRVIHILVCVFKW